MRVRRMYIILLFLLVLSGTVTVGHAEWPYDDDDVGRRARPSAFGLGPRAGYDFDGDTFSVGAQLRIPVWRRSRIMVVPSGDVFDNGSGADWQMNVDLLVSPGPRGGFYGGLGFGWVEEDGRQKRELAVNQVLGLRLPLGRGRTQTYVEARWTELNRETVFRLVFGLNLTLFRY